MAIQRTTETPVSQQPDSRTSRVSFLISSGNSTGSLLKVARIYIARAIFFCRGVDTQHHHLTGLLRLNGLGTFGSILLPIPADPNNFRCDISISNH